MTAPFLPSSGPTSDPTALAAAVEAAAEELRTLLFAAPAVHQQPDGTYRIDLPAEVLARHAVTAAWPIIATAERERIALLLEADADDEAQRPERSRDCCSRTIETWLREAAAIARAGTSGGDLIGSVWQSKDRRENHRHVRIEKVDHSYAYVRPCLPDGSDIAGGRPSRILTAGDGTKLTLRGYRLISAGTSGGDR